MALLMLVAVPLGGAIGLALGSWLTDTSPMDGPLPLNAAANLWIVLTITLAASGVLLGGLWQRSRLLEARASAQAAQRGQTLAELHALQAQVEPHFLFNTLAHLDALISQPTRHEARALLSHLTDYLHRTQPTARPAASQLSDELARSNPGCTSWPSALAPACAGASTPASKPPAASCHRCCCNPWWKMPFATASNPPCKAAS
jgi:hypothetical protein